ncbi:sialate O-acetylesterase [Arsenicibacter rosenii]|uniref:DUF11 domain-containing protein n=1 Tax=Arsenicibacter rosenii TaxID=1750698 RepID=A0A1S2VFR0_9BACT|nr:sialate O-acetylesterase [Arsenicibacter rosenii]OIN57125.1 hypothetical protein BLX24_21470 [Arsenicibacter rosenii]
MPAMILTSTLPGRLFFSALAVALICSYAASAQVQVTFPVSRIVFQRNNANQSPITITGLCPANTQRIEVMLTATAAGYGSSTNGFVTLDSQPQNGQFSGQITLSGGWYHLDVRAISNEQVTGSTRVSPIGVGEVFAIAGQSNGQGVLPNRETVAATDDRVSAATHFNFSDTIRLPLPPTFSQITKDMTISPRGLTSWCWGRLGDLLTQRLNVPVLFYNAAWSGTAVRNWRESIVTDSTATAWGEYFMPKMPYANLKRVLQDYVPLTGLRAVLWHQGEAEAYDTIPTPANLQGTPAKSPNYEADLKFVIAQSRTDAGNVAIPWMVARASVDNWTATFYPSGLYEPVTNAQTRVIQTTDRVFFGPITDYVQIPRTDGVHFSGQGLIDLANAWNVQLTNDFFNAATPLLPKTITVTNLRLDGRTSHRLAAIGSPVIFTLLVTNKGANAATNIRLRCQLPANVAFVSSPQLTYRKGVLLGTINQIGAGQQAALTFTAYPAAAGLYRIAAEIIKADQLDPDSQPNTSFFDGQDDMVWLDFRTIDGGTTVYSLTPSANVDPTPTVISNQPAIDNNSANLRLDLISAALVSRTFQPVAISVVVTNLGGATASNIQVVCQLPSSLYAYYSETFSINGQQATTTITTLPPNSSVRLVITAVPAISTNYLFIGQITAASPGDPNSTPNNGFDKGEDDTAQLTIRAY